MDTAWGQWLRGTSHKGTGNSLRGLSGNRGVQTGALIHVWGCLPAAPARVAVMTKALCDALRPEAETGPATEPDASHAAEA